MLFIPTPVVAEAAKTLATDAWLTTKAETNTGWRQETVRFESGDLTDERLAAFLAAADVKGDKAFVRVLEAIINARGGDTDKSVPRLSAFPEMLIAYLRAHQRDGWLYKQDPTTGFVQAYLVTQVKYDEGDNRTQDKPHVRVDLAYTGSLTRDSSSRQGKGISTDSISLYGSDATKKKVADILVSKGYLVETEALRAKYDEQTEHHREVLFGGYTEQFLFTGAPLRVSSTEEDRYYERDVDTSPRVARKVIGTTRSGRVDITDEATSRVFGVATSNPNLRTDSNYANREERARVQDEEVVMAVPMRHLVQVFDLATHEFMVVRSHDLTAYKYDASLSEKLVLPDSHRDLLDILTSDIATFTGDIIEGKSAGNVILSKGVPGVGKTLTAEVYSELIERPLYSIHSGSLGVTADSVRGSLETVFKRAKAWNAVLLLDEADVFVNERGTDITQNAIVAEFLRTMEYFDGLMFMTTNRAANIDEAVISRCAAIIDYHIPGPKDMARIWQVLAHQFTGEGLDKTLVGDLVAAYPKIAPRDVKMLLRLGLRVAKAQQVALDLEVFRKVSMFRGIAFDDETYGQHMLDTGRWTEADITGEA